MRLTVQSDYSLRVLMYLSSRPDHLATIQEIARAYEISENHLMKVVHGLSGSGFVRTTRGRGGGIRLGKPAEEITVGDVLRAVEEDFALVECLGQKDTCRITKVCRLKRVLNKALDAYFDVLDNWTLADLVAKPNRLIGELAVDFG